MMWPGPGFDHSSRARFQCTTSHPPVPRPSSTAVVLTTTRSPTATAPISSVRTYAGRPSTSTRCKPRRLGRLDDGPIDALVGHSPFDQPAVLHPVVETALAVDVVVLEVHQGHARVGEREVVTLPVALHQLVLDHPVALAVEGEGVDLE